MLDMHNENTSNLSKFKRLNIKKTRLRLIKTN